jgi:hypothetical protein
MIKEEKQMQTFDLFEEKEAERDKEKHITRV